MKHLRAAARRIQEALRNVNVGKAIAQARQRRRERNRIKSQRRELESIRKRKDAELRTLIKNGHEEGDRALKLAEEIHELDRRIADLRERQAEHTTAARNALEEVLRRKRRRASLEDALDRVEHRIHELEQQQHEPPATGTGPWAGTQSIVEQEVVPIYSRHGVPVTSRKRWETFGNPSSDHYMGNTDAYAADGGVATAYEMGNEVKRALTGDPNAVMRDYEAFYITRSGHAFRVQLIAATHGTGPHFHAGVKAA